MSNSNKEIVGKRYEMLTVLERLPKSKINCLCDCGKEKILSIGHFNAGYFKSCGCHARRHGYTSHNKPSREYVTYHNMIARCHKESNKRYKDYGAKGIVVCQSWRDSFINFIKDMGDCPNGFQIDRIDNNQGYYPENCRWVSPKENMANRSISVKYNIRGKVYDSGIDAAKDLGVNPNTIYAWCKGRIAAGRYYPPKEGCFVI